MTRKYDEGYADLHTHILPSVDDGPKDMNEAMELVRMAYEDGTRIIFLTPHYRGRWRKNTPEELDRIFSQLREETSARYPDLELYLGNEIHWETAVPDLLEEGRVLTLGKGDYCLLEFRSVALRAQVIGGVSECTRCGYIPIIAHAERYEIFRRDKSLTEEVLAMGALVQLNADSILGKNGWGVRRFCHRLLKNQQVHFIASDAHDAQNRPPLLGQCRKMVDRRYGSEYAGLLFVHNPRAILNISMTEEGDSYGKSE